MEDFRNRPGSFDIVITDQSMPVITGSQLAAELYKIRKEVKIIICTGYIKEIEPENPRNNEVCEFLLKPFDINALIEAVERNL